MAYGDHFKLADDLIRHLTPGVAGIADPFLASRYSGFVAVAAVTVYELAVKEIYAPSARPSTRYLETLQETTLTG